MEILLITGFFCFGPLFLIAFGYWLGKGSPGWPWAVIRRDGYDGDEGGESGPSPYRSGGYQVTK